MKTHVCALQKMNACSEAVEFAVAYPSLQKAWNACDRGDWMLWYAGKKAGAPESEKRKKLVLAACDCARLALKFVKKGEEGPRKAIETAEAWTRGEATIQEVRSAANAAYDAARGKILKQCAVIVRKFYPKVPR